MNQNPEQIARDHIDNRGTAGSADIKKVHESILKMREYLIQCYF